MPRQQARQSALFAVALAVAGYALSGPVAAWLRADPHAFAVPVYASYAAAVALAAATAAPLLRRSGPWPAAAAASLRILALGFALFAGFRAIPIVSAALLGQGWGGIADFFARYSQTLPGAAAAVLGALALLAAYRLSYPRWRPVPPKPVVQAFVVSLGAWCLLEADGLLAVRTGLVLSSYEGPVWLASAGYAAFWVLRMVRVSRPVHTAAAVSLWVCLTAAAYLATYHLNDLAVELAFSDRYGATGDELLPYLALAAGTDHWVAAAFAVLGFERSTSGYSARLYQRRLGPLFQASTALVTAVIVWGIAEQLQGIGPIAQVCGLIGFSALAAVAAGQAARALIGPPSPPAVSIAARWLASSQFRNANIGGVIALYASVLRPAIYDATAFAPLIEWLTLALPVAYLIARVSAGVSRETAQPPGVPAWRSWRRHVQNASPVPDATLARTAAVRDGYLETGEFSGLAVRVVTAMATGARPLGEITDAVRPLVDPAAYAPPRPRFAWPSPGAAARRERAARARAADRMAEALAAGAGPAVTRRLLRREPAETVWSQARSAFVERGDRVQLAVAATMLGTGAGLRREDLIGNFRRIVQYRDAKPRWYDLPSRRRRVVESAPTVRTGFADRLRSSVTATTGGQQ